VDGQFYAIADTAPVPYTSIANSDCGTGCNGGGGFLYSPLSGWGALETTPLTLPATPNATSMLHPE
jgi:hypothetical protein